MCGARACGSLPQVFPRCGAPLPCSFPPHPPCKQALPAGALRPCPPVPQPLLLRGRFNSQC
eukprot:5456385-Alexandrium_andersonii.AAC.1